MRLVTFTKRFRPTPGVVSECGEDVIDLSVAAPRLGDLNDIIAGGEKALDRVWQARRTRKKEARKPRSQIRLMAPIPIPIRNIFCVGKNYHEHAAEFHSSGFDASAGKDAVPDCPIIFTKSVGTVIGPETAIPASADKTRTVDYEVELAVIIGKSGRRISKRAAYDHVFGYTIVNDVTSRALQQKHKQWFLGKNFDGFCPMGPAIVTADEVGDPRRLRVRTEVNGELRQDAVVKDLIFDIPTLIKTISDVTTLHPGDIIATGTPAGVGIGFKPPKYLKKGDVVTLTIDKIGKLENPVA